MKKIFRLSVVLASLLLAFGCEATFFDHYMEAPADVRCKSDQSMLTSLKVNFSATESEDNPVVSYTIQLLKSVKDNPNISNSSVTKTVKSIDDATFTKLATGRCYYARVRVNYQNGVSKWAVSENRVKIGKGEVSASEPEDNIPNYNQIFYTTTDGKIISSHSYISGMPIISNVYEDGMGIITVENDNIGTISEFFNNEERLTSVKVPNIDTIEHSFTGCKNLRQFSYYRWNGYISDCYLACKNWLVAFAPNSGETTFTIPSDIQVISNQAFKGCTNLESVMIHGDLFSIGSNAFYGCSNLSAIHINAINPPSLESNSFSNCNSNLKIYVPLASLSAYKSADGWREYADKILSSDNLAEHSWSIVGSHNNWDTATGTEMTNIGDYAVANYVTFDSNAEFKFVANKSWDISYGMGSSSSTIILGNKYNGVFGGDSANIKVSAGTYCIKFSLIDASFVVEDALSSTSPENQIWYTSTDGKVVTPHSTNVFGANIVSNIYKDNMGVIIFDAPVTKIGDEAFYNCSKLASITIPAKVTTIGDKALFLCHALEEITIPDSVTSIGQSAISSCNNLMQFKGKFASPDGRCLIVNGRLVSFAPAGVVSYTIPDGVTSIDKQAFYAGRGGLASVVIPDSVSKIGQWAFSETPTLTDVIIGSGVTYIDYGAFSACGSLTRLYCHATTPPTLGQSVFNANVNGRKIYVPASSVDAYKSDATWSSYASDIVADTTVPSNQIHYTSTDGKVITPYSTNAFGANIVSNTYSNGKGVITFDGKVTKIGDYAFYQYGNPTLSSLRMPDSVTEIGYYSFSNCENLTSITLSNSLTYIGYAFSYCGITEITIPDSVTYVADHLFSFCDDLKAIYGKFASTDNRCLVVDGVLNSFAPSGLTSYSIPSGITTIGNYAFYDCKNLTSVTIPSSVTAIGHSAFGYTSLSAVTIPSNLQSIGEDAFRYCNITTINIPSSVTTIEGNPFAYCTKLATFSGQYATSDNNALIYNNILTSVASDVTQYTVPEAVKTLEVSSFSNCKSLTSVTIPANVTEIRSHGFSNCPNLAAVHCLSTTPPTANKQNWDAWHCFDNNASGRKIYVPAESVSAYKSAENWSTYADDIVAEATTEMCQILYTSTDGNIITPSSTAAFGTANIVSNTYENGQGVITFDGAVTSIGKNAFEDCRSLTSITIPNSVTSIGNYAFSSCSSLTSVIIGNSVTSIGYGAFYNCSSLTSVTIPDSVTSIMDDAFGNCDNLAEFNGKFASADKRCLIVNGTLHSFAPAGLTEYTIPDSVTKIGWCIFQNCQSITSITIPNSVTSIGESAFSNCGLTSVTIPDSVTSIKDGAFSGCDNLAEFNGKFASTDKRCLIVNGTLNSFAPAGLTGYTIPNDVTAIGNAAFYSCGKLYSVTIPDSVTSIGGQAFDYCSKLIEVFCKPTTPPTLGGTSVFYNNATGRKIYVPAASVETYKNANYWNEYADAIVAEEPGITPGGDFNENNYPGEL